MSGLHAFRNEPSPGARLNADLHEERAQARAYRRWSDMRRGRVCPSIEDMEQAGISGPGEVLIDLRGCDGDPELTCVGGALVAQAGTPGLKRLSQVPPGSLLSLVTAHHSQVATSRQPIAFEGEQGALDGSPCIYRGILLPLSSDGETVDFIHGMIGWHEPADRSLSSQIAQEVARSAAPVVRQAPVQIWSAS